MSDNVANRVDVQSPGRRSGQEGRWQWLKVRLPGGDADATIAVRVLSPEASGPSGTGKRDTESRNPRPDMHVQLAVPMMTARRAT